jgi:hypothetical protein
VFKASNLNGSKVQISVTSTDTTNNTLTRYVIIDGNYTTVEISTSRELLKDCVYVIFKNIDQRTYLMEYYRDTMVYYTMPEATTYYKSYGTVGFTVFKPYSNYTLECEHGNNYAEILVKLY